MLLAQAPDGLPQITSGTDLAAVLSGTIHVPLTAIFLIAEITGGYALFVPLMIASALSFLVSKYLNGHSIYGVPPTSAESTP